MAPVIESHFGLAEALSVRAGDVISLVGAGGKTTILSGLVTELRRRGVTVIATTTTHTQPPDSPTTAPPIVFASEEDNWLQSVRARVDRYGAVTVLGARKRDDKLKGLQPEDIDPLRGMADCVVIEADGARGRSLKAPASHEPVVPEWSTATIVVAGLDVLGRPLDKESVHRLEIITELTGAAVGSPIVEEVIALAIVRGYFPTIPRGSRRIAFLNKVDDARLKQAERVGELLLDAGAPEVVFGEAAHPNGCFYQMKPSPAC
jgi:probable selenium-dependent hydroxylase accessory protein YqeC